VLPVYRSRDARRGRHLERLAEIPAVYLGGGVADQLVEALAGEPFGERLLALLRRGGVVAAIAAAAQALGAFYRPLRGGPPAPGLGWLSGGVVEANFDPDHDRRLLDLLRQRGVRWAVGLPAGSSLLLGPGGALEVVGEVFVYDDPDGEPSLLTEDDDFSEDGDT
jgi:cyanophycinase-like exopeptidase